MKESICQRTALLLLMLNFSFLSFSQSPIANFHTSINSGCNPVNVSFVNTSQFATQYEWDFGNGMTSNIFNPSITYSNPGNYTITLIAKNNQGQSDTIRFQNLIQVNALPTVNFSYHVSSHCANNNTIHFTNLSDSSLSFVWDFGDGNSSTLAHPTHHYADTGSYSVKLIATDSIGCNKLKQATQSIRIVSQPNATFSSNLTESCDSSQLFSFHDSSQTVIQWRWDFGDGDSSQFQHPTHVYHDTGKFNVQLIGIDTNGCSDTLLKRNYISVHGLPNVQFSSTIQSGCTPLTVQFEGDSTTTNSVYSWDFGNGILQNGFNVTNTYTNNGVYDVMLTVEDKNSCVDSFLFSNYITAYGGVSASFTSDTSNICINSPIQFNNTTINGVSFEWNFGDSTLSTVLNPTHSYNEARDYTVSLTAIDSNGCESTFSKVLSVIQLKSDFTTLDTIGCSPHQVSFRSNSAHATKWFWNFGDGNTSQLQNPIHIYQNNGNYSVELIVESFSGCTDTLRYNNLIKVGDDTVSTNLSDTIYGCLPLQVDFTQNQWGNNEWHWNFGNGDSSNVSNPSYTFLEPGHHTVSLSTQNTKGCPLIISNYATIVIDSIQPKVSVAQFDCSQKMAQLTDSTANVVSWFWDFGDGTYSTLQSPIHLFSDTLNYNITLTITTSEGCTHSLFFPGYLDFTNCFVNGAPTSSSSMGGADSSFTFDSTRTFANKCAPQLVQFSSHVTAATAWFWSFGDGKHSNQENPMHFYHQPGKYTVSLIAETPNGPDTSTWVDRVTVNGPSADFTVSTTILCDSVSVQFNNQSHRAKDYLWKFKNGFTSALNSPSYTFSYSNSNYPVKLITIDSVGCTASSINILNFPKHAFNATISNNDICISDTVFFQPNDTNYSYSWDFGDGTSSNSTTAFHTYSTAGKYYVSVTQHRNNGCNSTLFLDSIVVRGVSANFSISDSTTCKASEVSFFPIHLNADKYLWKFGDQDSSLLASPHFSFREAGMFDVSLTLSKDGCSSTQLISDAIKVKDVNTGLILQQNNYCFPVQFNVVDTSSQSTQWSWKVDGNEISTTQNASFSVLDSSSMLSLFVEAQNGCIDSLKRRVLPKLIKAKFTPLDTVGCVPMTVQFSNLSINSTQYLWQFGDGDTSTAKNPSHVYQTAGKYSVSLISYNSDGCSDTTTFDSITASSIQSSYTSSFSSSCAPMVAHFSNESSDAIAWHWEFGNGSTSNLENPLHIYNNSGSYDVSLSVTNSLGCSDTIIKSNEIVVPGPITNFSISDTISCGPSPIQFTDSSTNAAQWNWAFGDGNTSTSQHPIHTYAGEGNYTITLITTDINGCTGFFTSPSSIVMKNKPIANFSVNETLGCVPFEILLENKSSNASRSFWNMGNGVSLGDTSSRYTYLNSGQFNVSLYVENSIGCLDSTSIDSISAIATPDASILKIDPVCENDHCIQLRATNDGGEWFGNGVLDTTLGMFHPQLVGSGAYQVYYKFDGHCPSIDSTTIEVKQAPNADFHSNINESCEATMVQLNANIENNAGNKYTWLSNNKFIGNTYSVSKKFTSGNYNISLAVTATNGCSDTINKASFITIYDSIPSQSNINRVSVINDSKVWIEWEACLDAKFDHYILYRKAENQSEYTAIKTFFSNDETTFTDTLLNTLSNTYCYKVSVVDKCNRSLNLKEINAHCTINVILENASQNEIKISWNAYKGCTVNSYEVIRTNELTNTPQLIAKVNAENLFFIDTSAYCNMKYSYRIKAVGNYGLKLGSYSDTALYLMQGITLQHKTPVINATVKDNSSIQVKWAKPTFAPDFVTGYIVHRSENEGDFIPLIFVGAEELDFEDYHVDVMNKQYNYRIEVVNECPSKNNLGDQGSSILLETIQQGENSGLLKWNEYQEWREGVNHYKVQRLNEFNQWETIKELPSTKTQTTVDF